MTLMAATPGMALSQANLIVQKGFNHSRTWFLMAWRPQKNRLQHLLNAGEIKSYHRGFVRGISIHVDEFAITRIEAENSAILKIEFDLTNYHSEVFRSNEAFRSGSTRNLGHQLSPLVRPSTKPDRQQVYEYLPFQGLSVTSDRYVHECVSDRTTDSHRAQAYYWQTERFNPTMVCPSAFFNKIDPDHLKAYEQIDFDLRSNTPKFLSEFHLDKFVKALKKFQIETLISEQFVEFD